MASEIPIDQSLPTNAHSAPARPREIKIGLVLYGGVSLAIYEYGVARCFYELVRGRGAFDPLLEALESTAQVDVIAGTSAGGINGILLAAALESGQEMAAVSELWLREGDLGGLFRQREEEGGEVSSLLDGEGRYQRELEKAFTTICQPNPATDWRNPGEIDLFVTGTDVAGYWTRYHDALGTAVDDKRHRVVFHLKHRPGRRALGLGREQTPDHKEPEEQAAILASLSRLTSGFPAAFPPFRIGQLERHRDTVARALDALAQAPFHRDGEYIDGGVLDNKPFGPLLEAIFYRMPAAVVDRKIFYVEPDPLPKTEPKDTRAEQSTPLAIAFGALSVIPSHESILGDIDRVVEHNERIRWLVRLGARTRLPRDASPWREAGSLYHATRVEALARSMVLSADSVAAAQHVPADPQLRDWQEQARDRLEGYGLEAIDPFDVEFHMRRAFHLLYVLYGEMAEHSTPPANRPEAAAAELMRKNTVIAVGRIVKVLKMIRRLLFELRAQIGLEPPSRPDGSRRELPSVDQALGKVRGFLDEERWEVLAELLQARIPLDESLDERHDYLPSDRLDEILEAQRRGLPEVPELGWSNSILQEIARHLEELECGARGSDERSESFEAHDAVFYPLAFLSGIHELDRIDLVRVSPLDARVGLSGIDARDKVAGDEIAHFAAFLRRDWRSNDILWGRIDGVERIVLALLDPAARKRMRRRVDSIAEAFADPARLASVLPRCPADDREALRRRWEELLERWRAEPDGAPEADLRTGTGPEARFAQMLVRAAQEDAAGEELPRVFAAMRFQELKWGRLQRADPDPQTGTLAKLSKAGRADTSANDRALEAEALREARDDVARLETSPGTAFRNMRIGAQLVSEEVPTDVIGEYGTRAYLLLWGMLQKSIRGAPGRILRSRRVRPLLHSPVRFANWMFSGIRNEPATTTMVAGVLPALLLGASVIAIANRSYDYAAAAILALLVYMVVVVPRGIPEARRRTVRSVVLAGTVLAAIVAFLAFVGIHMAQWAGEWLRSWLSG